MTNGGGDRWAECIELAVQVAVCAGKIGAGRKEQRVTSKATPTDLVTEADQLLEEFIISTLRDRFPSHRALILTEIGAKRDVASLDISGNMSRLLSVSAHGVRIIGSSILALCQVACGRAEGYYHYGLHCWDMAAADIIIRETGTTSPLSPSIGGPVDFMSRRVVAAGSLEMANNIIQQLQPIGYERDDHDPSIYTLHISWHSCPFKNVPHAKT
ncbi:inositol monophosphatase 2-like [Hypomesus transpacificus]|uniref:inositol monophosphatase 2-like n=1 Tax=Hypomesus transpacificus TaxID=137520 RepID=UPI001F073C23|nr:inositol monophosphatase 2-like [Hypomesus transpacificus]